jgi:ERCC4-type nuclease
MTIQVDSREHAHAITKILATFDKRGVQHFVSKLTVGDYSSLDKARFAIDRKQSLNELAKNVQQEHDRFIAEITRANNYGIRLVFLCEHGKGIKTLNDVLDWENPRIKVSPLAVTGVRLFKILSTISVKYNTEFLFCDKRHTGDRIIELLGG